MFRRLSVVLCAILAVAFIVDSADARKRWRNYEYSGDRLVLLAEQDVDLALSRFEIDLRSAKGAYKGVRIRNKDAQLIDVMKVTVVWSSGDPHVEDRQIDMYRGERSRTIPDPLPYENRFIDKLIVDMEPLNGRAKFQVFGIQDEDGRFSDRSGGTAMISRPSGGSTQVSPDIRVGPTSPEPTTQTERVPTEGGDILFGAQYVGFGVDRDVIPVGNEIGKFDRIRLRVLDNDIHINEIKVVYASGETEALAVDADIPKNSRTNWIDINGSRFIKEIQLVYRSRPSFRGQARIEVFGRYAPGWLGPSGEGRKYNQGWVLLGAQTAGFVGFDRDVIPVGANEGGFKKLRVTVKDRAITLNEVRVIYSDGSDEIIPIRTRVDAGGTFGPIDLKGQRQQRIERIEAKYRSRIFSAGQGSAIVEMWGQH